MDLQKLFDAMSDQDRRTRSQYQMTLGALIDDLKDKNQSGAVYAVIGDETSFLSDPHSYRGYYSDLSLTPSNTKGSVADLLAELQAALGSTFEGYKGGDFLMGADTPVWVSPYGVNSQIAVMSIAERDGDVALITKSII